MSQDIGFEIKLDLTYNDAIDAVVAALKEQGFGVLTRIDVQATLKEKLGQDFRPYMILGACNPPLAHQALSQNSEAGLMLPCNVTVEADPDGGSTVRIANPEMMMTVGTLRDNPALIDIAHQAKAKLEQVAAALTGVV